MTKLRWRYGIIAGLFLALFASYPQLKMIYNQGDEWNGHYAYNDIDEVAYAAYLKALIDGRPRKNDPYTGRDNSADSPQPESLFSIQFAAPYAIAIPARILGISAPTAMTITGAIAGFLTALACFWFIGLLTGDSVFAMTGSLVVLCGGALAAGEGAIGEIAGIGVSYPYFPFLRRYVPAVPFPVFFLMLSACWCLFRSAKTVHRLCWGALVLFSFSFLLFSYFYIWTAAAALLSCLGLLFLLLRPKDWQRDLLSLILVGAACFVPLAAYGYLLSNRAQTLDKVQLLVFTRQPDLWRFPEYISLIVLLIIAAAWVFKAVDLRSKSTLFALSLALVPFILFNQQVVTGRSLQPIHYQVFIGNYIAATALVYSVGLIWKNFADRNKKLAPLLAAAVAVFAVVWGFVECHYTVRVLDRANVVRDRGVPLARELAARSDSDTERFRSTILSIGTIQSDDSPTLAPQNVLWSRHQHIFAGLSWKESKQRYYQYHYYQNHDEIWLERQLKNGDFVSMISLFGWARHSSRLSFDAKPLTNREIEDEVRNYKRYREMFGKTQASDPKLSYVVVPRNLNVDFSALDQWYKRDAGEDFGIYRLYKVILK